MMNQLVTLILVHLAIIAGCANGDGFGAYVWGHRLWQYRGGTELLDFLVDPGVQPWFSGDLYINIADYSSPRNVKSPKELILFILNYRALAPQLDNVVWLTYGDRVTRNGTGMVTFTIAFFDWAASLSAETVTGMGKIGISFDVEGVPASVTREALTTAQALKYNTSFLPGNILVQHTIEGRPNPEGTDAVMRHADSALMMAYRNYMHDPTGTYSENSNLLQRLAWMLRTQCELCLDDETDYRAQITVMVEAACGSGVAHCGKVSFCAHDGPDKGLFYVHSTLQEMWAQTLTTGLLTHSQRERLFNPKTTFAIHDWRWFRCMAPIPQYLSYLECAANFTLRAKECRASK